MASIGQVYAILPHICVYTDSCTQNKTHDFVCSVNRADTMTPLMMMITCYTNSLA